ncbi:MAG: hypothetical protein HRU70_06975 [Phycisphaeraceae bacterium]|nr:MAG: hypothetical protein HRU70_06975 [Phycisphaeraceae bacterium]
MGRERRAGLSGWGTGCAAWLAWAGSGGEACSVLAQPAEYFDLGAAEAPAAPPYAGGYVDDGTFLPYVDPPELLTVRWVRFELIGGVSGDVYLDFDARVYTPDTPITFALYDSAGGLIAVNSGGGGFPSGGGAGLSFGSSGERVPFVNTALRGQDGSALASGVYWFAVAAGSLGEVTAGATGWGLTTTASYTLEYDEPGLFTEVGIIAGNTAPPPRPVNDDCADALPIGENAGPMPSWVGTNFGATQDGVSPCYPSLAGVTMKDVWFRYVPSVGGWAEVEATGGAGGAATPLLTLYDGGCGGLPTRCSGGGSFVGVGGTRLRFPVEAGEARTLGLAVRAGQWGPMRLDVRAVGGPCELSVPAGAVWETEGACDTGLNDGCTFGPGAYDALVLGRAVRGWLTSTGSSKDDDWFRFVVSEPAAVPVAFEARQPIQAAIVRALPDGCAGRVEWSARTIDLPVECGVVRGSVTLPAGAYFLRVTPTFRDGVPCGDWLGEYWASVGEGSCPADFNGDGFVDFFDFDAFVGCFEGWECPPGADADLNGDGFVDFFDYDAFVEAFEAGC